VFSLGVIFQISIKKLPVKNTETTGTDVITILNKVAILYYNIMT